MLRLIEVIFLLLVFLVFIMSNLDHRCDVSFVGWTRRLVPVYVTAFGAFVLGMLTAIPVSIGLYRRKRAKERAKQAKIAAKRTAAPAGGDAGEPGETTGTGTGAPPAAEL